MNRVNVCGKQFRSVPLLAAHDIPLLLCGEIDPEWFVHLFNETWLQLPLEARNNLLGFWREFPSPGNTPVCPLVALLPKQQGNIRGVYCPNPLLVPWPWSRWDYPLFLFYEPSIKRVLDEAPERLASAVVAHELGHALRHFQNERGATPPPEDEEETDNLVRHWGFPMDELRRWIEEHPIREQQGS